MCEPHKRLNNEQLLPQFLLGLRSPKLHDQLTMLNITSFETCNKEAIRLGDNMREGYKNNSTSVPWTVESKDSNATPFFNFKETSKDVKGMSVDELVDLIVARLNPPANGTSQGDQ